MTIKQKDFSNAQRPLISQCPVSDVLVVVLLPLIYTFKFSRRETMQARITREVSLKCVAAVINSTKHFIFLTVKKHCMCLNSTM